MNWTSRSTGGSSGAGAIRRPVNRLIAVLLAIAVSPLLVGLRATPAHALCTANPIEGDWYNIDSNTNAMTRVVVETCQSVTTCDGDICRTVTDSGTYMNPYGSCHPTDCDWGRELASHMGDGWYRTIHDFGFKTSHVWAKTYEYWGRTYLRLWVYNDFTTQDGRQDYTTDEWFLQ